MIVYVEAVLFDNFCLDYLLARMTLSIRGKPLHPLLFAFSATIGCVVALVFPMVSVPWVLPVKIGTLLICSAIFSFGSSLKEYAINTFLYLVLSFLLCGILSFLLGISNEKGVIGGSFGGVVGAISLGVLLLLYVVRQVRGLLRQARIREKIVVAELVNQDKRLKLDALYDSGNLLTDEKGNGIVLTDEKRLSELGELFVLGEMQVNTATGGKRLKLVKIPEIKIYSHGRENILTNVTAALSDLPDEYALILPCE